MSDTDDTDILVLIPPDLFLVQSSDTDDSIDTITNKVVSKSGVISQLLDHVETLNSRVAAIEENNSFDRNKLFNKRCSRRFSLDSKIKSLSQTLPRTRHSVSPNKKLQSFFANTKPQQYNSSLSLPSSPVCNKKSLKKRDFVNKAYSNIMSKDSINSNGLNNHDPSVPYYDSSPSYHYKHKTNSNKIMSSSHASMISSPKKDSLFTKYFDNSDIYSNKSCASSLPFLNSSSATTHYHPTVPETKYISDMSLSEVDDTIQTLIGQETRKYLIKDREADDLIKNNTPLLKYLNGCKSASEGGLEIKRKDLCDYALPVNSSLGYAETEKFLSEFKSWNPNKNRGMEDRVVEKTDSSKQFEKDIAEKVRNSEESVKSETILPKQKSADTLSNGDSTLATQDSCPNVTKYQSESSLANSVDAIIKNSKFSKIAAESKKIVDGLTSTAVSSENDILCLQRPKKLLTLSDFWENDSTKTQDEILRIKLEEEKLKKEHCEQLIQDLQKQLLEREEKIAVAIKVDNEKNIAISQFHAAWHKLRQRQHDVEQDNENLKKFIKNLSDKHESEIVDFKEQIKNLKDETSKTLNLATGYKEKSDSLVQEKLSLLKAHAEESKNYKSLLEQAESRYEKMKEDYEKSLEKNKKTDEILKNVQQELHRERLRSSEVRSEMANIHKALDDCEAELNTLREQRESLQLKIKEEITRCNILTQEKSSLLETLEDCKNEEKRAKLEVNSIKEQQEILRSELRDVYQKQVDEVVKTKLQEFQSQLDAAEVTFQNELEAKQRAIAECAARKIKAVIDKHQLEVSLLEEKHKEEKGLYEVKLAQAIQKAAYLEVQLNNQNANKNQIVEQLHTVMQNQWQQAVKIISGENSCTFNGTNKVNLDSLLNYQCDQSSKTPHKVVNGFHSEPMKLESQKSSSSQYSCYNVGNQNDNLFTLTSSNENFSLPKKESSSDLKRYIKMILDMQQSNPKTKLFSNQGNSSPPSLNKDLTKKSKEANTSNDGSSVWQPISDTSLLHDTSEYLDLQAYSSKSNVKQKPPWK